MFVCIKITNNSKKKKKNIKKAQILFIDQNNQGKKTNIHQMSQLFEPFREVGVVTGPFPFAVQQKGTEHFITCNIGKAFQIYQVCV